MKNPLWFFKDRDAKSTRTLRAEFTFSEEQEKLLRWKYDDAVSLPGETLYGLSLPGETLYGLFLRDAVASALSRYEHDRKLEELQAKRVRDGELMMHTGSEEWNEKYGLLKDWHENSGLTDFKDKGKHDDE
tara:strand:- start:724 stop:1116 length:393 start_codon:yes stop_codon:yes gene_type:complete